MSESEPSAPPDRRGSLVELCVVFGLTVLLPLSIDIARGHFFSMDFGQRRLLATVAYEALAVALLWPWLAMRGWAFRTIAGAPEPIDLLRGVGLAIISYMVSLLSAFAWVLFDRSTLEAFRQSVPTGTAAAWAILLVVIVNPVVEEFLWLGYGFTALSRFGMRTALWVSVALRVSMHLYQGRIALIGILPLSVVFTAYYARTRRIWPVISAHVLFDTLALVQVLER